VDLNNRQYTLIDPKNRKDITLPLPNYLFSIMKKRIGNLKGFKYLFPGTDKKRNLLPETHLKEPKVQVKKIIEECGVKFTVQDLRRVFMTTADSLDLSMFAMKRLINHSMGSDVTSGYVVSDVERLRGPMQKIEDKILQLAKVNKPGKVVPIRRSK
jgi:hypothetical protein